MEEIDKSLRRIAEKFAESPEVPMLSRFVHDAGQALPMLLLWSDTTRNVLRSLDRLWWRDAPGLRRPTQTPSPGEAEILKQRGHGSLLAARRWGNRLTGFEEITI
jgi:hypothetical protein